ncbi:MAG: hypothetical protein H0X51_06505 [Parachlamydiaceae bacterium]|nr:hypothetical protein [Parachlamydiaceae bacterium]
MNLIRNISFLLVTLISSYACAQDEKEIVIEEQVRTISCDAYLTICNIQEEGHLLTLDDGSEWEVKYYGGLWRIFGWGWTEQKDIAHWAKDDLIEILYPGSGNFIDFLLIAHNVTKNEKACIDRKQNPSIPHSSCLWVVNHTKDNRVSLSDGSTWQLTSFDAYGAFINASMFSKKTCSTWNAEDTVTLVRQEGVLYSDTFYLWNHTTNEMPQVKRSE